MIHQHKLINCNNTKNKKYIIQTKSREVSNFKDVSHFKTYALYTVSMSVCAASDTDIFTYLINSMQLFLFLFLLISKETQ